MAEDEYLTPEEAAKLLKVSLLTIRRRLKAGAIPAVQIGRLWRIKRADLLAALAVRPPKKKARR